MEAIARASTGRIIGAITSKNTGATTGDSATRAEKIGPIEIANIEKTIAMTRPPSADRSAGANRLTTERRPERRRESPSDRSERGSRDIVKAAVDSVGKRMYEPMLSYSMGRLGCAASVSGVLKEAGYKYANSALVYGLHNQLLKNGWQKLPVSEARPGDVIIGIRRSSWQSGGGGSHIGIVGYNGTTYHNSSARRHWIEDTLARWNTRRYPRGVFVLRPPTN